MEWGPTYEATLALKGFSLPAEVVARWTAEAFDGVEHVEHSRSRDHYVAWERERLREMVREPMKLADGYLEIPDAPGLGIELDLKAIPKYPPKPWRRAPVFEIDGNIGYI